MPGFALVSETTKREAKLHGDTVRPSTLVIMRPHLPTRRKTLWRREDEWRVEIHAHISNLLMHLD